MDWLVYFLQLRRVLENGTLYFTPFDLHQFHADIHKQHYQCRARNQVGIILSRTVTVEFGMRIY